jgi:type II secretory ATPase GspE/PulE/Tfp pilus assembly ATPase PilB-like protein
LARKEGSLSLFEDGILKVKNGITTLEELLRVAEPPAL